VELALRRLRTDVIDVMHFHSCPVEVLERPGVVDALTRAVEEGKVRVAAYSGDNAALEHAIASGRFGAVQCSVNLFDQRAIERGVPMARARGLGVIAKRPLGNAPWRFPERPHHAGDIALYWERMKRLELDARGLDWSELALRFAAFVPGVSTCIVGTSSVENLQRNLRALERGPLPADAIASIREAFQRHGAGWDGQI
jgi:aryl-alcohol dehydrogenase-like predicted oxidoreductase